MVNVSSCPLKAKIFPRRLLRQRTLRILVNARTKCAKLLNINGRAEGIQQLLGSGRIRRTRRGAALRGTGCEYDKRWYTLSGRGTSINGITQRRYFILYFKSNHCTVEMYVVCRTPPNTRVFENIFIHVCTLCIQLRAIVNSLGVSATTPFVQILPLLLSRRSFSFLEFLQHSGRVVETPSRAAHPCSAALGRDRLVVASLQHSLASFCIGRGSPSL